MTTEAESALVRDSLPGYEIGGEIGHGGCGVVLSGRHRALSRPVAIKQLPPAFASDPAVRHRFAAEGRLLASLDHPHVVPVYDFVEHDGLCLLVMEMLPGGTVWSRFTKVGFNAHSAVAVALACAAGLTAAHTRGILHRDVKPENLMFAASGAVKVTDFGIAKVVGGDQTLATREGDVLGTPSYIAPEQARGGDLSPATDVYALATMLYELLSGSLPFPAVDTAMAMLFMHAFDEPIPLLEVAPTIPEPIAEVVMRGLATDPAVRFPTAESFGVELAAASTGRWGPGWLAVEGIPVMGADSIVTAAGSGVVSPTAPESETSPLPVTRPHPKRATAADTAPPTERGGDEPPPTAPGSPSSAGATADRPTAASESTAGYDSDATMNPTVQHRSTSSPPVRPSITVHPPGARLVDLRDTDLVPVQSVLTVPSPRVPFLAAGALGALAVAVALVGVGSPASAPLPPPGAVTVAGADPAVTDPVALDLTQPIPVTVADPGPADAATVSLRVLGRAVQSQSAPLLPGAPAAATVPPLGGGYLVAGSLTGEVALTQAGGVTQTWQFPVRTAQRPTTTAVAAGVVVLLLFAFAYLESFLRSLLRGRRRVTGSVGVPASAAVLAVGAVGAVWVLLGHQPTVATIVVSAVLASAAGVAAVVGASRVGRTRRYRRAQRR